MLHRESRTSFLMPYRRQLEPSLRTWPKPSEVWATRTSMSICTGTVLQFSYLSEISLGSRTRSNSSSRARGPARPRSISKSKMSSSGSNALTKTLHSESILESTILYTGIRRLRPRRFSVQVTTVSTTYTDFRVRTLKY